MLAPSSLPCPKCGDRPGRLGRNGSTGWCFECAVGYRHGGAKMTPEELAASKARAVEKQRATLAAKRAAQGLPEPSRKPPRSPRKHTKAAPFAPGAMRDNPLPPMSGRTYETQEPGAPLAHVVEALRFSREHEAADESTNYVVCTCGERFSAPDHDSVARRFQLHVQSSRPSRSGPVEVVAPDH